MYFLDLLGTLAFAISGAFKAKGRALNIFGVVFLGLVTAMGGGTIRDLIIKRTPLFYLEDSNYLLVAALGAVLAYFAPTFFKKRFSFFRLLDSIGLAAFAIIGTSVVYHHLYSEFSSAIMPFLASVFLGTLTGVGGGILRDAIIGDTPYALKHGSNYIAASFVGALIFYILMFNNIVVAITVSITVTLYMREVVSEFGIYKRVVKNNYENYKDRFKENIKNRS
jgi:uncharacterized membrane protein YeiH